MKPKSGTSWKILKARTAWKAAFTGAAACVLAISAQAQTVTNPSPNRVISWNLDDWSTINPNDLAGLAPATNWVDTYLNNITTSLPDNTGTASSMNLAYGSYNTYQIYSYHVGYDANGTANREMLNGFLNAGPAAWNPPVTNTYVALTNVPYAKYDVVIYLNSDTSGRHASIDNGTNTYYFSTMGSAAVSGTSALFAPTTQTNSTIFPSADFAFFSGMTNPNAVFTEKPKSGNDQWLGITSFQVIQASNAYVLFGPSPASQIVPVGQPASFNVMAGGLNPVYQWQHAGTNILNATNATYSIAATVAGQDGNYAVIVSNNYNSVTSVVATLTFYSPKTVEWDGNGSSWDTTSLFWTVNGGVSTTSYTATDNVRFGPLGAGQPVVTLSGTETPGSLTVSNGTYILTSGGLAGSGSMHVMNNGTLVIDTPSTTTGPTLVDSGSTLVLDNGDTAGSLGSGMLTNNGGLVFNASGDEAYGYPIYGSGGITNMGSVGTITLGNNVSASYLVQSGGGILLLQGSNTLSSGLVVSSGTVWARATNCLGANTVVNGGELQLYFTSDFPGTNLTLGGGLLHGGVGGNNIYEGVVTLAVDSQINIDGGNSLTLNNPAGISGSGYNLTLGNGIGTLILAGTNNTWASVTINTGTLQIGNGGANASLGSGSVTDTGTLAFNSTGNLIVTNPITGSGGVTQLGSGTTAITGDMSSLSGNIAVNAGKLLVNTACGAGAATVSGGALGGNGSVSGPVSVLPGATLAPGTAAIGTLTLSGGLTLGGNVSVKINRSLAQSNDLVSVSGTLSNTNNGTVTVANLGGALAAGNKFTLFSQPVIGGATMGVTGGGVTWSNNLANDGSIIVLSTLASYPTNISYSVSGGTLSLTWPATHLGWILQSQTNSLSSGLATNWVDVAGSSSVTATSIPISQTVPSAFYRLRHP